MFSNFVTGAVVSNHHHCKHTHTCVTPGFVQKDDYGNIAKLQWTPDTRTTIELTSDSWLPVPEGSIILNQSGQTPEDVVPSRDTFAYNTVDYLCWKGDCNGWALQPEVVTDCGSRTTFLFSDKSNSTRCIIKNFREEVVRTFENVGNIVSIVIDDTLAQQLLQGYYNIDVYHVSSVSLRHVRRIGLSIGNYVDKSVEPDNCCGAKPIIPNPSFDDDQQDAWELRRALLSVATIAERDSLDCRTLVHGKVVRVANTEDGVKYYSWDQVSYTWKEETFSASGSSVTVDQELSKESDNAISNSAITQVIEEVKTKGDVESLTEDEYSSLLSLFGEDV